jgi:hypothetical protein
MYYEPSEFEEFTSKLAQGCVNPPSKVWTNIEKELNNKRVLRHRHFIVSLSAAASIAIILSLGSYWLMKSNTINPTFAQISESNDISFANTPTDLREPNTKKLITENSQVVSKTTIESSEEKPNHRTTDFLIQNLLKPREIKIIKPIISNHTNLYNKTLSASIVSKEKNPLRKSLLNGWSISGMVSPTFTQVSSINKFSRPEQTQGLWLLSGEVVFKKKISKWFSIQSGLGLSPIGQMVNDLYVIRSNEPDNLIDKLNASTSLGIVGLNSKYFAVTNYDGFVEYGINTNKTFNYSKANLEQRLYYIELPVVFAAKLGNLFPNISIKTGVSAGYLITNDFKLASNLVSISGKNDIKNRYAFSTISSLEYSLPIGKRINMLLEPSIKINLIPIEERALNNFPLTFNLKIGFSLQ